MLSITSTVNTAIGKTMTQPHILRLGTRSASDKRAPGEAIEFHPLRDSLAAYLAARLQPTAVL
jgi:hypothetical protein